MSSYGVVGRVGVLVEPTFRGVQRKVKDGLGVPLANEGTHQGANLGNSIVAGTTRIFKWGGVAAGAALGAAITKGFGRLRAMEDAQAKIRGLGYEAQEVEAIMGDVQGALDGTMFLYSEGADVAAGALAAGVQQGEELEAYLRLTADAATQAGLDFGTMGHMMNKVSSSGKLTGDVLNQLEQNGVYVGAAIADSLGVTQEEFRKMVSQGEVSADVFQKVMYEQFAGSSEEAANTMTGAMSLAWTAVGQLGEKLIAEVYPYLRDFFKGFYDWVQEISPAVEDFGKRVGEALGSIIGWLTENPGAVKAFAAAVGAVFAAMAAYTVVVKVQGAISGLTNAFKGLNAMMAANPVGVWVAAIAALVVGLIWAWNNVDWFRDAVTAAWDWISDAALWAWENVLSPTIDALVAAWEWVAETFTHVWENYLQPVFEGIGTVFSWLWENILEPYIGFIMGHFQGLGELFMLVWENVLQPVFSWFGDIAMWIWENVLSHVFSWIGDNWQYMVLGMQMYWEHILKPVFQFIGAVATWLWEKVLSPVFSWIGEHWGTILDIMKWAWDFILKPVFTAVAAIATWLWEHILSPIFTWIGDHWDEILFGMKWAWENVLKPAWDFLAKIIRWLWDSVLSPIFTWIGDKWDTTMRAMKSVWENVLKPAFELFGDTVQNLKDKFETAVDNIKKAWDRIKAIAAKPIKFVIEKVINDGLIKGFNKLVDWIPGVEGLKTVPLPGWMDGYSGGGYTGDGHWLDAAGIVHRGEYVIPKKATNRLRDSIGWDGLEHLRHGRLPGYSGGGLVRPVNGRFTSGFGAGRGRYPHAGVDWAVPIGTPVKAALAGTVLGHQPVGRTGRYVFLAHPGNRNTYYGHLSRPMVSPGDEVAKGQIIGLSGNTGRSTGPHLHFETWTGGKPVNPLSYMGGLPESASGGETGGGGFDILAPFRAIGEKLTGWITDKFPTGIIPDVAKNAATGTFDKMIDFARSKIPFLGDPEDTAKGMGTVSKGPVQDQVRQVASGFGWGSGAEWSALSRIIQKESSWNPNAANPSSSARGLFQKMTSAHGPVESTAGGQAKWGLNYIKGRYGSPSRALAFHNRNNWYADGGYVNPLFRDRGGNLPPGLSMVLNKTGRDEAILNSRQWQDIHSLAQRGSGGPGVHIENAYALSSEQLARDIATEQRRSKALQLI